ncbi:MAG: histone deacetylase family protein [Acidimicrobiia bacterium]
MTDHRLAMPVVWTKDHRLHDPAGEVWVGVRIAGSEVVERAEVIRAALESASAPFVEVVEHGPGPVVQVHGADLVDYLDNAYAGWLDAGLDRDPGQNRVVPYVFPLPQLMGGRPLRTPVAASALAGCFAMDTTTSIGPDTYRAARAAADAALTAADQILAGAPAAYAACRPPGHHAGTGFFGGSCYLNNAAIAAQWLRTQEIGSVAIVDLDAHHGNGTQQVFYDRPDVFYGSLHVDPGAGWFPHFVGFADEIGDGAGRGSNHNVPLAPGSGTGPWLAALKSLLEEAADSNPAAAVVSLGLDAWKDDPESPLQVEAEGFSRAGEMIADLGVPVVFVQEGGYDLTQLGNLVVTVLAGFEKARIGR